MPLGHKALAVGSHEVILKEKGSLTRCHVKVIDFKTATEFLAPGYVFTDRVGTPYYCSPQATCAFR